MLNLFLLQNPMPAYIPQAKASGLGGKIDKVIKFTVDFLL